MPDPNGEYVFENFSNGRPVYKHRRSLSTGLNAEGQPTTDQIEQGEIAINLSTRKLYTKRPNKIRKYNTV